MYSYLLGTGITVLYITVAVGITFLLRKLFTINDELFRKILHFILLGAYIPLVFAFDRWWMAAIFAASLIAVLFPALFFAQRIPMFSSFVNERKKGEFVSSMVYVVGMMAFSVSVCWGLFGDRYLVLASVYAWGVGDALAALIGKRFGKHKIRWRLADTKKSVEGSLAMLVSAFVSVLVVLLIRGGVSVPLCIIVAALAAIVCTLAELCTKYGLDTLVCPVCAMAVIIPMVTVFGG